MRTFLATFLGIPFRYWDDVCIGTGIFLILVGVWLRYRIVEVRMFAEEDVKSRKYTEEQAERRVRNRTLLINAVIVAGMGLVIAAVLILVMQSEMSYVATE